jgi:hypothetical protein
VGARYVFVPGVLVLWLLVLNVRPPASSRRLACGALLAWVLVAGAWSWRASLHWSPAWPAWAAEADAWERRPRRTPLRIWPRGWIMRLAPRRS